MARGNLLPDGAEVPGRYLFDPATGHTTWQGDWDWHTLHGPATVEWLFGKPFRIEGASTPDGRMDIERASPGDEIRWRRRSPGFPGGWVHGTIALGAGDVVFSDLPPQTLSAPEPLPADAPPSLTHDMACDGAFLARLQDDGFAHAVCESMRNVDFRKDGSNRFWSISAGRGGGVVADLRSLGEHYMDFHLAEMRLSDGRPANVEERVALMREVHGHYRRMGWSALGEEERAAAHAVALAEIAVAETRPEGPCPDWAEIYPDREPQGAIDRAIMAARSGRLSKDELGRIVEHVDVEADLRPAFAHNLALLTQDDSTH